MVLEEKLAVTPVGKPDAAPIPVTPVVVCVISGDIDVFTHKTRVAFDEAELLGVTIIVPVAFIEPQPPVKGIM